MSSRPTPSKWTKKPSVSGNAPASSKKILLRVATPAPASPANSPKSVRPIITKKIVRVTSAQKMDSRVRQSRNALGDALIALIQEQPFDSITVQQVLDRAQVGRSTFYHHFRDKDDLFLSDADEFFQLMSTCLTRFGDTSNRVAPVSEFFAHVAEQRQFLRALVGSQKFRDVFELGEAHFARAIDARLAAMPATRSMNPTGRAARAHALAGALFSLLLWWINHKTPATPQQMDDLFHQLVWSGIHSQTRPSSTPKPKFS